MLENEPFFLTAGYTKSLLAYFYESDSIDPEQALGADIVVKKLRKVI